jgi:hypothetical protein
VTVTWPQVVLAAIGMVQLVALAWIAAKQAQVKRDLNGGQDSLGVELQMLRSEVKSLRPGAPYSTPRGAGGPPAASGPTRLS